MLASYTLVCSIILLRFYYPFTDWSISDSTRTTLKELTYFFVVTGGAIGAIVLNFMLVAMIYLLLTQIIIYVVARYKLSSTIKASAERYHEGAKAWFQKDGDTTPEQSHSTLSRVIFSFALFINLATFNSVEDTADVDSAEVVVADDPRLILILAIVLFLGGCLILYNFIITGKASLKQYQSQNDEESKIAVSEYPKQEMMPEKNSEQELIHTIGDDVKKSSEFVSDFRLELIC
ncbi:hypothetical protein K435DRAFT_852356 [Dendrothele bispora CBS 962.96]|uniref:Uncharacterized protein n=1 Tax=Dendrothele bispora (strain CBS 962.96) TaxID=1314807 RepID=A0A4S8ML18_DENBC|nr:hypothetical protein K435DRAFT_852356 [Dendrothele bispora CBS 962.96]